MSWLDTTAGTMIASLAVAAVTSGLVLGLLKLGPDRRKIASDAKLSDANAASLLTGQALAMVENAQQQATAAQRSAARAWRRVHVLENMMRQLGIPVPPDDEEDEDDPRDA